MKKYILITCITLFLVNCSEEVWRGIPRDENTPAPPRVSEVEVTPTPGGATITYKLPESDNLLYVMAEYTVKGKVYGTKSSFYTNSITIEGLPDTTLHQIKLYSVSRDGVKSEPYNTSVIPLTPPIASTLNTAEMAATFGGIKVNFNNDTGSDIKLIVLTTDSIGEFYETETFYTKIKNGMFYARGFAPEERLFGLYVVDRWNNYSDTLFVELTPLFEELIDKSKFSPLHLPTDSYEAHQLGTAVMSRAWDESLTYYFHTVPNSGMPQWFTFDMGQTARFSRFKLYHRKGSGTDGAYSAGAPRKFELYGSNNPDLEGGWDSWTLLGQFDSRKPSGSPDGQWTSEDFQYATEDGEDFEIDNPDEYRYLRFKTLQTWGNVTYIYIAELTFWGEIADS